MKSKIPSNVTFSLIIYADDAHHHDGGSGNDLYDFYPADVGTGCCDWYDSGDDGEDDEDDGHDDDSPVLCLPPVDHQCPAEL